MLMAYVAADRYLKAHARLGFVLPQTLFKGGAASEGFRRFLLPDGMPFAPFVVEDMGDLQPFEGAANKTMVTVFTKGTPVRYPVSYQHWRKRAKGRGSAIGFDTPYEDVTSDKITFKVQFAEPVDPTDPTSNWITGNRRVLKALRGLLGASEYVSREGTNSGGANAVFWLEVTGERPGGFLMVSNINEGAKKKQPKTTTAIEPNLVYPLLRASEIQRWAAHPKDWLLLTHEVGQRLKAIPELSMQRAYPKTYAYLKRFEDFLRKRPVFKRYFKPDAPFYSIFAVGDYTFSKVKVVWPNIASSITAAVVMESEGKPIIPQHIVTLLPVSSLREAHYCCAALNSAPFNLAVQSYSQKGGKSFGTPHVLEFIRLPTFDSENQVHGELARLSESAHKAASGGSVVEIAEIEAEVDKAAAKLWGLSDVDLAEIKRSLEDM
jgi:hypothetical protein